MTTPRKIYVIHSLDNINDLSTFIDILRYRKPLYIMVEKRDCILIRSILDKQAKEYRPVMIKASDIDDTDSLEIYTFSKTLAQFSSMMRDIKKLWIKDDNDSDNFQLTVDVIDSPTHDITINIYYFSILYEKFTITKSDVYFKFFQKNFKKTSKNTFTLKRAFTGVKDIEDYSTFFESPLMSM